jgi:hypothetical protein
MREGGMVKAMALLVNCTICRHIISAAFFLFYFRSLWFCCCLPSSGVRLCRGD